MVHKDFCRFKRGNVTFNGGTSVSGIASVHNTLQFTTTGGAHIDHVTNNQNLYLRNLLLQTQLWYINAASEQTKFRKIITGGLVMVIQLKLVVVLGLVLIFN